MPSPEKAPNHETAVVHHTCRGWHRPPASLALNGETVHVWRIDLAIPPPLVTRLHRLLSNKEKERAARMRAPGADRRFVVSHGATRAILARYLTRPPEEIDFLTGAGGKPYLALPPGAPALCFNLSHSADLALCAVAMDRDLGVDVERIRPVADWPQIAARYFSPNENEALLALSDEAALMAFFQGWTGKEAYTKALGRGISRQWSQFTVSLAPDTLTELPPVETEADGKDVFTLRPLAPAPGYVAAVAARGTGWRLDCWHWPGPDSIA